MKKTFFLVSNEEKDIKRKDNIEIILWINLSTNPSYKLGSYNHSHWYFCTGEFLFSYFKYRAVIMSLFNLKYDNVPPYSFVMKNLPPSLLFSIKLIENPNFMRNVSETSR